MRDIWECACRELTRRKGRALATMLGYALAVGILAALVGFLLLAKAASNRVLTSTGTHFIAFIPSSEGGGSCAASDVASVNSGGGLTAPFPLSYIERIKRLPTVKHAAPFLLFRFRDTTSSNMFTVGGFDPADMAAVGKTSCAESDLIAGRFLKAGDTGSVMLEESYARQAGGGVGDTLLLASTPFRIVGIINPGVRPAKADVYMLFPDVLGAVNKSGCCDMRGKANMALVEVKSATVQDEAIQAVRGLLAGGLVSSYACYKPAAQVIGMNERTIWLLGLIVAVFAVAFAMKSQLSAVMERKREIGILKAIGWTDNHMVVQILAESMLQAIGGGIAGCVGAVALLWLAPVRAWSGTASALSVAGLPLVLMGSLALAVAGGIVAGILPAVVAARQRPVDAMRRQW